MPERRFERIINRIKALIATGEIKCGEKLPSERDLAEKFNVSRVPIREALKILEYMGVLEYRNGDGLYVQYLSVADVISKIDFALVATEETIFDLLEVRILLETHAAYLASQNRTDEDIAKLHEILHKTREMKRIASHDENTIDELRLLYHAFHRQIINTTKNKILIAVYESLYEFLDISRQFTIDSTGISYNSILAHESIINKIIEKNAEEARARMAEHLEDVRDSLKKKFYNAKKE